MDRDLEILALMRKGTAYKIPVKIRDAELTLRPLTVDETEAVAGKVQTYMASLPESKRNALAENTAIAKQTLIIAATDPEAPGVMGDLSDAVLGRMTNDEIHFLMKQYVAVCDKVNPSLEQMPAEEVKNLIETLKKKEPAAMALALIECSFLELVNVCQSLMQEVPPTDR